MKYWAVVPAAGIGKRMGAAVPKQYLKLGKITVLEQTLHRLGQHPLIAGIIVAVSSGDPLWSSLQPSLDVPIRVATGGAERCHSVLSALELLSTMASDEDWVLVHDAARPCLRGADIDRMLAELGEHPVGGLLGLPVSDTVKRTDADGNIRETVSREGLWRALTPQMFRLGMLRDALNSAIAAGAMVTDEAAAVERMGLSPRMVEGHPDNIKITRPGDLAMAAFFLELQEKGTAD